MQRLLQNGFFWLIVGTAMLVSGNATYELLTTHVGIISVLALAAAVVIDAAAIWLGHHATTLAKLGDSTADVQMATWLIIAMSLAVNFTHGYLAGGWIGGFVGTIFPFLAALLFHFYISHTIRETLRSRGRILPEPPVFLKSRKFGNKARQNQIQRDYVNLTYDMAEDRMRQLRDKLGADETSPVPQRDSETTQTRQIETAETSNETASLVDHVFAAQMLRDINETMTIKQIIETLVGQGIKDYDELETAVVAAKGQPVSRGTIRKTASRVIRDSETGE